ncbi:HAD-like domain-containing protein [Flagelloscypha sp. PMI_526]|nr:HAD-like domain-containing protein [Flagelloscypha sp. PMI_526]
MPPRPRIKLVTFDALHTILKPRFPISVQYARVFEPYLGPLDVGRVQASMKSAIRSMQKEKPVYDGGAVGWWHAVIQKTALGAGANPEATAKHLDEIASRLMRVFTSKEGYSTFNDTIDTFKQLRENGVKLAVISNADSRMHNVLKDLALTEYLDAVVLSEDIRIAKPDAMIFREALARVNVATSSNIQNQEMLHVGDELDCDYHGAKNAGMNALLLRRPLEDEEGSEDVAVLSGVQIVTSLGAVALQIE